MPLSTRSTEDDYVDTVRLHLVPALGRKPLAKLTVADLDRLWKAKREAGYSSNSVRIMRTVLRRALGQAVREGIVARNVAGLSAAPRIRAKDGRTLTVDQARQLLEAAAGYRFEAAVVRVRREQGAYRARSRVLRPFLSLTLVGLLVLAFMLI